MKENEPRPAPSERSNDPDRVENSTEGVTRGEPATQAQPVARGGPASKAEAATKAGPTASDVMPKTEMFVVGIGASAGGLDAMQEIMRQFRPSSAAVAVIVVQHLEAHRKSELVTVLERVAAMPVQWAENGMAIEPGHVYVAPPKTCVRVSEGVLLLQPADERAGTEISFLFRALADDARERAVGVILSGNSADGSAGLQAIHRAGGLVLAQDPATAAFPVMPQSAIDAGCVDRVLSPTRIARELEKLTSESAEIWRRIATPVPGGASGTEQEQLATIFRLLATRRGVDFSEYKQSTIRRRLVRRMALAKIRELADYVRLLQRSRDEVDQLYESMLINVTEFFRDPESFEFLRREVLPGILRAHEDGSPIRVWVPGCSTGEETYSLGIIIRELLEETGRIVPVQIFSTDIGDAAIRTARAGLYSVADVANVSPERLGRFFFRTEHGYSVQKPIRDMCVFARQNVLKDSPFSRVDLISCRNLMIYLSPRLQRKLMPMFHYALVPDGYLFLGNSESVGGHVDLFRLIDRRFRVYSRRSVSRRANLEFMRAHLPVPESPPPANATSLMPDDLKEPSDIIREADRVVLSRHGPIGALVNDDLDILQFRGDVSPYLAPVPGRASLNLMKMAREGLLPELEAAVREAREQNVRVQRTGVAVSQGDVLRSVDIDVTPIASVRTKERFFLILFSPAAKPAAPAEEAGTTRVVATPQVEQLRRELQATRSYLQSTIEKHETTNQELRAANEEIQSSNEELQSTNEELETAKEELQSTNEELTTVNEELHSRQLEMMQLNNDLQNLINSVHLPIVILGQDLRIRRFTPMAQKILNVIPTDVGRPFSDINTRLNLPNLPELIAEVFESLTINEVEVQDVRDRWYSMRLRPYKTAENKIEGVVLTLIDIDEMKRAMAALEAARNLAQAVLDTTREAFAVLTPDFRIQNANEAFYRLFEIPKERAQEQALFDVLKLSDKTQGLRQALEGILPTHMSLTEHKVRIDLPSVGASTLVINVRQIASGVRTYPLVLLSVRLV